MIVAEILQSEPMRHVIHLAQDHLREQEVWPSQFKTLFLNDAGDLHCVFTSDTPACYVVRVVAGECEVVS